MPTTTDIMLDIETLDTGPTSVVLSIGLVGFNVETKDINTEMYFKPNINSQSDVGRTMSTDTLAWWIKQNNAALIEAFSNENRVSPQWALSEIDSYLYELDLNNTRFWAKSITFDYVIMRSFYETFGAEFKIPFWNMQEMRTLKETIRSCMGQTPKIIDFEGDVHNALADAVHQSQEVIAWWHQIKDERSRVQSENKEAFKAAVS